MKDKRTKERHRRGEEGAKEREAQKKKRPTDTLQGMCETRKGWEEVHGSVSLVQLSLSGLFPLAALDYLCSHSVHGTNLVHR